MSKCRNIYHRICRSAVSVLVAVVLSVQLIPISVQAEELNIKDNQTNFVRWSLVTKPLSELPKKSGEVMPFMLIWKCPKDGELFTTLDAEWNQCKKYKDDGFALKRAPDTFSVEGDFVTIDNGQSVYWYLEYKSEDDGEEYDTRDGDDKKYHTYYIRERYLREGNDKPLKQPLTDTEKELGYGMDYDDEDIVHYRKDARGVTIIPTKNSGSKSAVQLFWERTGNDCVFTVVGHCDTHEACLAADQYGFWDFEEFYLLKGERMTYRVFTQDIYIGKNQDWNFNTDGDNKGVILPAGKTFTIEEGATVWINGNFYNNGRILNKGTLIINTGGTLDTLYIAGGGMGEKRSGEIVCQGGDLVILSGGKVALRKDFGGLTLSSGSSLLNCGDLVVGGMTRLEGDSHIENRESGLIQTGYEFRNAEAGQVAQSKRVDQGSVHGLNATQPIEYDYSTWTNPDVYGLNILDQSNIVNYGTIAVRNALKSSGGYGAVVNMGSKASSTFASGPSRKGSGTLYLLSGETIANQWKVLKTASSGCRDFDVNYGGTYTYYLLYNRQFGRADTFAMPGCFIYQAITWDPKLCADAQYCGVAQTSPEAVPPPQYRGYEEASVKILEYFPFCTSSNGIDPGEDTTGNWLRLDFDRMKSDALGYDGEKRRTGYPASMRYLESFYVYRGGNSDMLNMLNSMQKYVVNSVYK